MRLLAKFFLVCFLLWNSISLAGTLDQNLVPPGLPDSLFKGNQEFKFLSMKLNVDPGDLADVGNLKAHFRILKDSVIWCSVNSLGGIEVARVLLTPDSVRVIERINNKVLEGGYDLLQKELQVPVEFADIQALILNRFFVYSPIHQPVLTSSELEGPRYCFSLVQGDSAQNLYFQKYNLARSDGRVRSVRIDDPGQNRSLLVQFDDPVQFDAGIYPKLVSFLIQYPGFTENFSFEVLKISHEKELEFPFKVPKRYRNNEP